VSQWPANPGNLIVTGGVSPNARPCVNVNMGRLREAQVLRDAGMCRLFDNVVSVANWWSKAVLIGGCMSAESTMLTP
jgi:hypothetical protein